EDLQVVEAVPTRRVERRDQRRQVGHAVSGKDAVAPAALRPPYVRDMDSGDVDVLGDVAEYRGRVPEVPRVELETERAAAPGVRDQLQSVGDRAHDRPLGAPVCTVGLDGDSRPGELRLDRKRP